MRYPRGTGPGVPISTDLDTLPLGRGRRVREGQGIAILNFGSLLASALTAAETLGATVVDMRFVKPLDEALIRELAESHNLLVTLEENTIAGGAGSAVCEFLNREALLVATLNLGLPDRFVDHGKHGELLAECGLDAAGIEHSVRERLARMKNRQPLKALP